MFINFRDFASFESFTHKRNHLTSSHRSRHWSEWESFSGRRLRGCVEIGNCNEIIFSVWKLQICGLKPKKWLNFRTLSYSEQGRDRRRQDVRVRLRPRNRSARSADRKEGRAASAFRVGGAIWSPPFSWNSYFLFVKYQVFIISTSMLLWKK